jgi:hypothetical protein
MIIVLIQEIFLVTKEMQEVVAVEVEVVEAVQTMANPTRPD